MNTVLFIVVGVLIVFCMVIYFATNRSGNLNKIKSNVVGDGQYGDAKWATNKELHSNMKFVLYEPEKWREGQNLPQYEGIILGTEKHGSKLYAMVDTDDNHTMFVAAPSGGKTTSIEYPNIEYSAAVGSPIFVTDTKGDPSQMYGRILQDKYHFTTYVIDMRNPSRSDGYNLLTLTNKYIDMYNSTGNIEYKGRAEMYAKNVGKSVINLDNASDHAGTNKYFYTCAEAVVAAITYLVSELCDKSQRHIVSVFKIIRQIIEIDPETVGKEGVRPQPYLMKLYNMLPENHISKDLLSSAAYAGDLKTIGSILSTATSQMLSFIDSEMEQLLCFDDGVDIEKFVEGKTAIFFIFDESSNTKNFISSLLIRQTYNELLKASERYPGNRLPHRVQYFLDEFGTFTSIEGVNQFFSAGRSRNIMSNPFLQSLSQLDEKYGEKTARTIRSCCQNIMFGWQAPLSDDAKKFSDFLGTQTVRGGSVSNRSNGSNNTSSTTYQMVKKPLMSPNAIKEMKKGEWVLMKTGQNPVKVSLPPCEAWGIKFDENSPYKIASKSSREVSYADRTQLFSAIQNKYRYISSPYSASVNQGTLEEYM